MLSQSELVTIMPRAAVKVHEFLKNENKELDKGGLRLYVAGGGCSGLTYGMALENGPSEEDIITEKEGLRVFVDPFSAKYLKGSTVDYVESIEGSGFKINNPNVTSSCGCGHSFQTS